MQETASLPPDILVTGYFKEQYGYAVYRSRGSGNWLITYTLHGQGLYRQPGVVQWAEPGDLVLLRPGAVHDYSVPVDGSWEFLWAHFQPRQNWLSWLHLPEVGRGLYKVHLHTASVRTRVEHTFLKLHGDTNQTQALPYDLISGTHPGTHTASDDAEESLHALQRELTLNGLEEILLLSIRDNTQHHEQTLDPRVQRVLELITLDLRVSYDLGTLAEAVALSPSRLSHLFKQEVGDSLNNVIIMLRLRKAARLLQFSAYSITKIAEEAGFSSTYYFSRQFHQHFGVSPRAYRATHTLPLTPEE